VNKLRRMCAVVIVTAVLAVSASAGIMDSPGVVGTIDSPGTPASSQTSTDTSTSTSMTIDYLRFVGQSSCVCCSCKKICMKFAGSIADR